MRDFYRDIHSNFVYTHIRNFSFKFDSLSLIFCHTVFGDLYFYLESLTFPTLCRYITLSGPFPLLISLMSTKLTSLYSRIYYFTVVLPNFLQKQLSNEQIVQILVNIFSDFILSYQNAIKFFLETFLTFCPYLLTIYFMIITYLIVILSKKFNFFLITF